MGTAGMAMAVTHISTAMAGFTWMLIEWSSHGKPSVLGIATGAVAGLVAITPASGFVGPVGALVIGLTAGVLCYWGANGLKRQFGYDDSLDVFGVHGIGGMVGALLTGVFASSTLGGSVVGMNIGGQLWLQVIGVVATLLYSGIVTFVLVKIVDGMIGIRVTADEETTGLDLSLHHERGYSQ